MSTIEDNNNDDYPVIRPGEARIKKEYLIIDKKQTKLNLNFVSEADKQKLEDLNGTDNKSTNELNNTNGDSNVNNKDCKRELDNDENKNEIGKKRQKKLHGQNKKRLELMMKNNIKNKDEVKLCSKYCGSYGLDHINEIEKCSRTDEDCKYGHDVDKYMKNNPKYLDENCYMFDQYGFCGYGHRCKFGKSHLDIDGGTFHNKIDEEKFYKNGPKLQESYKNFLNHDIKMQLKKKKYDFSSLEQTLGPASIEEREWKKIDFNNKLYLAPLTTVGNLPFRRICKEFGADITCGEMAVAQSIVEGHLSEWALLKRHSSEDIFGVQLTGGNPQILAKATKLINDKCDVDFIDLNIGCPIELICQQGGGVQLMARTNRINQIITSMSRVSEVPLTIKMRNGINNNKYLADKVIQSVSSQFEDGRIALMTIHGRSKEARYTKVANWDYIRECSKLNTKIPIFGNGDIFSFKDYEKVMNCEDNKIAGTMIGRGALVKPWLFTEIKERRDWDISSNERLDIVKKYVNYGLEYFGCDYEGVEKTRKFLLEFLSFSCRYIPVGLLEVLPQKLNERPPPYFGRNELETLLSSSYCEDWIKISEMFLGKVKNDFIFLPKHKANSYHNCN